MTFNTKDLRDGHLPLIERIDVALRRVTNGEGQMRVPVEATDPDIVLHNCRDRIVELEAELAGLVRSGRFDDGPERTALLDALLDRAVVMDGDLDAANLDRRGPFELAHDECDPIGSAPVAAIGVRMIFCSSVV